MTSKLKPKVHNLFFTRSITEKKIAVAQEPVLNRLPDRLHLHIAQAAVADVVDELNFLFEKTPIAHKTWAVEEDVEQLFRFRQVLRKSESRAEDAQGEKVEVAHKQHDLVKRCPHKVFEVRLAACTLAL